MRANGSHHSQPVTEGASSGDLSFGQVFGVLRRRWWLLIASAIVFYGVASYVVPQDVTRYQGMTVVRLTDPQRALTGNLGTGPTDNVAATDFLASQVAVIRSRGLVSDVVERNGLRLLLPLGLRDGSVTDVVVAPQALPDSIQLTFSDASFRVSNREREVTAAYGQTVELGDVRFVLNRRPSLDRATLRVLPQESAIDMVLAGLRPLPRERTPVIDIVYQDFDPGRARKIANEITLAFQEHNAQRMREQSRLRREFIEEQLAQMEARLEEAQNALTAFRSSANLYSSRDRLVAEQSALMNLEIRREELAAERRMLTSLLARVEQTIADPSDQEIQTLVSASGINANPIVAQAFNRYVQYSTERRALLARGLAETHHDVEPLTQLAASARVEFVNAIRSHIASLDVRIASLNELHGRSAANVRELPAAETIETHLFQEVESARGMANLLRNEYQRARIAEAVELGQVEILDLATFASAVRSAGRNQRLFLALFLGLIVGGAGAIGADRLNSSIRRREELEELLHVPGLGVIPAISNGEQRPVFKSLPNPLKRGEERNGRDISAHTSVNSTGAEAYRVLRTNLVFSNPSEQLRTLVVTSADSGEGKTTTAANLAVTLARQGMRVLLIDADLRRPQLHRLFRLERDPGFVDLLLDQATAADVVRPTGIQRLSVVPRGVFDSEAVEVLGSARTRGCLEEFSREFDMVILDTPPVLVAADAAAIGALADGVLLVIRAGRTNRNDVRYAFQQLTAVGGRVVGSVLNDPDHAVENYAGYYKYGYSVVD